MTSGMAISLRGQDHGSLHGRMPFLVSTANRNRDARKDNEYDDVGTCGPVLLWITERVVLAKVPNVVYARRARYGS